MPAFLNIFRKKVFTNLPKDPAILLSIIVIWCFLLLFIIFPLSKIFLLTFEKSGHFFLFNLINYLIVVIVILFLSIYLQCVYDFLQPRCCQLGKCLRLLPLQQGLVQSLHPDEQE